jgi:hypothetical protein
MNVQLETYKKADMIDDAASSTNEPGDVVHSNVPLAQGSDPARSTVADGVVYRDLCLLGAGILVHIMQIDSQLRRGSTAKQSNAVGRAI